MMLRRYHKKQPALSSIGAQIETDPLKSLEEYTLKELRDMCKERGLKGYSKMSEAELIALLEGAK